MTMLSRARLLAWVLGALQGVPPSKSCWCPSPPVPLASSAPDEPGSPYLQTPHARGCWHVPPVPCAAGKDQRGDRAAMLQEEAMLRCSSCSSVCLHPPDPCPARYLTALYPTFPVPPTAWTHSASSAACATGTACPGPQDPGFPAISVLPPH